MKWLWSGIALGMLLVGGFILLSFSAYRTPGSAPETTVFIDHGTGGRAMVAQLHEAGVVSAPWKLMLPLAWSGDYRKFKAGEYHFAAGLSPEQVFAQILRGEVIVHSLTIPEGWSVAQVRAALLHEQLLSGAVPETIPEGSIAPDTVRFERGDTREHVVQRLQKQQSALLNSAWMGRADELPLADPMQALVLASIVEEETGVQDERAKVAAVYINRLRLNMPLQADPTVAYGVSPQGMNRPLSRADLKTPSAYNTYLNPGLPPGPICNPGKAAINAALHPADTKDLFFVATGHGGHNFAVTPAEHQKNVLKYRAARKATAH